MDTFEITYNITLSEGEQIDRKIEEICLEQSVELPRSVLEDHIQKEIVGEYVSKKRISVLTHKVTIAWPLSILGGEITQFLNVLYGNISLKEGIQVIGAEWEVLSPQVFGGPAFGITGIRSVYEIPRRPLGATALKPMGKSPSELGDLCYRFACGGIDIIKDDHGLANQEFAPFEERVKACVTAIDKACEKTGRRSYYYPNITASSDETIRRYQRASEMGADGVLLCPHISGLETMHRLARMDIDLPVIAHPAFSGQLISDSSRGLTPDFLYGGLWRALGADFVIYPNKGGRFSFTSAECKAINRAARDAEAPYARAMPMPAGGMDISTVENWVEAYGNETAFLIGGDLYEHPDGIMRASEEFRKKLII